ncbi:MAG: nitroreductase [Pseudomonadota bacterium]
MTNIQIPTVDEAPEPGEALPAAYPSQPFLEMLARRRSTVAMMMAAPGPDRQTLDQLLTIAARVPDHGKLAPFRFVVFDGDAREAFGDEVVKAAAQRDDEVKKRPERGLRELMVRAPVVVAVISSTNPESKIPEWEQILTAGAVCHNLLLTASAAGFAGQWLTEWLAFDDNIAKSLSMGPNERIAGFIHLGTAKDLPKERPRPDVKSLTTDWSTSE